MEEVLKFKIPMIRTINETFEILKKLDPDTGISPYCIREIVKNNSSLAMQRGKKYLINVEKFIEFLNKN